MKRANPRIERLCDAYVRMAKEAHHRPQAPSDSPGRLEQEAVQYALRFHDEEDTRNFWIGCSNFTTNRAFVFCIEAARCLASGDRGDATAIKLLEMAAAEVKRSGRKLHTRVNTTRNAAPCRVGV
jgi:hypothetical protein